MARLVGVDLPREKRLEVALTYIFGMGRTRAQETLAATGVSGDKRVREVSDEELVQLRDHIASRSESGRASKPFVRHSGHMRLMYSIKQEEGRILTAVDETQALLQEVLRQILIPP